MPNDHRRDKKTHDDVDLSCVVFMRMVVNFWGAGA
jgi:hypothetical protein